MKDNQYIESFCVTDSDCISAIDSSMPSLLGTYILVKWMEIACAKNIKKHLDEKHITVGEKISIEHTGMVKNGETVEIISTIQTHEKRNVSFTVEAKNNGKMIANASHERVIIPTKLIDRIINK